MSAGDILSAGIAAGTIPATTIEKYVYAALHGYVIRTIGSGQTPAIVQVAHSTNFRINEPADPWPPVELAPLPRWLSDDVVETLVTRVQSTSVGDDPTAFEVAVCDAFAALGFVTQHVGGNGEPDGILDAPLGGAKWRAKLECKTGSAGGIVVNARPEEPAKFREPYGATRSLMIGPSFPNETSLMDELRVHDVALWTTADLATVLREQIGPDELTAAFAAGPAERVIASILWERAHGNRKRIAFLARLVWRLGWEAQLRLAAIAVADEAPKLTRDSLLLAVDQELAAIDPTILARARCSAARSKRCCRTASHGGSTAMMLSAYGCRWRRLADYNGEANEMPILVFPFCDSQVDAMIADVSNPKGCHDRFVLRETARMASFGKTSEPPFTFLL